MLLALGEQVVPSADDATLVLIVDHLQLVRLPRLPHLQQREVYSTLQQVKLKLELYTHTGKQEGVHIQTYIRRQAVVLENMAGTNTHTGSLHTHKRTHKTYSDTLKERHIHTYCSYTHTHSHTHSHTHICSIVDMQQYVYTFRVAKWSQTAPV